MTKQIENEKLAAEITRDPRWLSTVARDKESDGKFFYSVKTTGVYCRPPCGARLAHAMYHAVQIRSVEIVRERYGDVPFERKTESKASWSSSFRPGPIPESPGGLLAEQLLSHFIEKE